MASAKTPPAPKRQRTDEKDENDEKEPEERERDAGPAVSSSKRPKQPPIFHTQEMTVSVTPSTVGNVLSCLSDGGFQYLLSGARASVGLKAGRYMFEVKILELVTPVEDAASKGKAPRPLNYLRVGVSTAGSSLFLGQTEDSVGFDADGSFVHNAGTKPNPSAGLQKLGGCVLSVVVNLDARSKNANTVSLFRDGVRVSQPQKLPDGFKGKALFPTVTFRNVALHYNFGPNPLAPLPFVCRTVTEAPREDVSVTEYVERRPEVVFPVCLPNESAFDWLDDFLEKNPHYTELSERAVVAWAEKSGISIPQQPWNSKDKPGVRFGMTFMDDMSVKKLLEAVAPLQQRSFVVMEQNANLLKDRRAELLQTWEGGLFKKTAMVMMGEPTRDLKSYFRKLRQKSKQAASDKEHAVKMANAKRNKVAEKTKRRLERTKRKADKIKKKAAEQAAKLAKKKAEEAKKRAEEFKKKAEELRKQRAQAKAQLKPVGAVGKKEEPKVEEKVEEKEEEKEKKEEVEEKEEESEEEVSEDEVEVYEPPPKVSLTEDEKREWFHQDDTPDLSEAVLSKSFGQFSLPDRAEGFDEVKFEWQDKSKTKEYLKSWVMEKKSKSRVEDIQPGEWFATKLEAFQKTVAEWKQKMNAYRGMVAKKANARRQKEVQRESKRRKKEADEKAKANGSKDDDEAKKEKVVEEKEEEPEAVESDTEPVNRRKLDIFGVEDIMDIGGGEPLFASFTGEDFVMLNLRFEIYAILHGFVHDVDDADRPGVHLSHVGFYYQKYFKKPLNLKMYGVEKVEDLLVHIMDTVIVNPKTQVLQSQLPANLECFGVFAMITEEARRDNERRENLGDKSLPKLNITAPAGTWVAAPKAASAANAGAQKEAAGAPTPFKKPVAAGGGWNKGNKGGAESNPMQAAAAALAKAWSGAAAKGGGWGSVGWPGGGWW